MVLLVHTGYQAMGGLQGSSFELLSMAKDRVQVAARSTTVQSYGLRTVRMSVVHGLRFWYNGFEAQWKGWLHCGSTGFGIMIPQA